ncbi:MAG: hypothetical protein U5J95_07820 [Balneolaceae bacterium]|nr:hypothetical protein [Balneolaceae bacterium]
MKTDDNNYKRRDMQNPSIDDKILQHIKQSQFRVTEFQHKEYREKPRYRDKDQSAIEQTNSNRIPELSGKS